MDDATGVEVVDDAEMGMKAVEQSSSSGTVLYSTEQDGPAKPDGMPLEDIVTDGGLDSTAEEAGIAIAVDTEPDTAELPTGTDAAGPELTGADDTGLLADGDAPEPPSAA